MSERLVFLCVFARIAVCLSTNPYSKILNTASVRYVVVGGIATLLHGYARLTADVDLAVDLAPQEALKMIRTLTGKGFRPQVPVQAEMFAVHEEWL